MRVKRLLVLFVVIVAACKSTTPAEQIDSIKSWVATAEMVGEAWLARTAPDEYCRQTLELSQQTLLQISSDLLKSPPHSVDWAVLDRILTRSREHVDHMARLIEAKDAPDFGRQLDSLRADRKVVDQLSDSIESQQ